VQAESLVKERPQKHEACREPKQLLLAWQLVGGHDRHLLVDAALCRWPAPLAMVVGCASMSSLNSSPGLVAPVGSPSSATASRPPRGVGESTPLSRAVPDGVAAWPIVMSRYRVDVSCPGRAGMPPGRSQRHLREPAVGGSG
jgi:hypothetical protein